MIPCPRGCPFAAAQTPKGARTMRGHLQTRHGVPQPPNTARAMRGPRKARHRTPRPPSPGRRIRCPHCHAAVGAACINPQGVPLDRTHKPRLIASKARAAAMSYAAPRGTPRSVPA